MRCLFCDKKMLIEGSQVGTPITLPGRGIAHSLCAEKDLIERRVFGSIQLATLPQSDLYELRELVLTEINSREGHSGEEIDLF